MRAGVDSSTLNMTMRKTSQCEMNMTLIKNAM